tara:strand:- start:13761 stop:13961 length:201 start_codon:yes stop_codon:yes gene_type:complete
MNEKQLLLQISNQQKEIAELYVVIDTLQTNLRSAVGYLSDKDKDKIINVQSYKWCTNWQQGDEKNV